MRILTKESVSMYEAWHRLCVDIHGVEMSQRIAEKSKKRVAHGGKVQRLEFSLRILHNELTIAVYLHFRDLLLFQFLRITENSVKWRMSVSQEMVKNCAYQMNKCTNRKENFETYFPRQK